MEEMLKRLIYAWRTSKKISDGMERLFETSIDMMYDVHGNILDALREFAFETCDLDNSRILKSLESGKSASEVAEEIIDMHFLYMVAYASPIMQPKPHCFTDEQVEKMRRESGGYSHDAV